MWSAALSRWVVFVGDQRQSNYFRCGVEKVDGERVSTLAEMFRAVWAVGPAGADIPITVIREGERLDLSIASISRGQLLKGPQLH